jgi:hypothetical protein
LTRAHISQPDGTFGMKVKRCFSFSDINSTVELVNEEGCPEPSIMSEFRSAQFWIRASKSVAIKEFISEFFKKWVQYRLEQLRDKFRKRLRSEPIRQASSESVKEFRTW